MRVLPTESSLNWGGQEYRILDGRMAGKLAAYGRAREWRAKR
ncbi:hypothetical protein [Endothiovibrio diazotrophicus]